MGSVVEEAPRQRHTRAEGRVWTGSFQPWEHPCGHCVDLKSLSSLGDPKDAGPQNIPEASLFVYT